MNLIPANVMRDKKAFMPKAGVNSFIGRCLCLLAERASEHGLICVIGLLSV